MSIIPNYHIPHCGQKLISYTAKVNFFVFRFWLTIVRLSLARNSGIIIKSPIWLSFYFGIGFCFQCLLKLSRIAFCALFAFLALLRLLELGLDVNSIRHRSSVSGVFLVGRLWWVGHSELDEFSEQVCWQECWRAGSCCFATINCWDWKSRIHQIWPHWANA